MKFANQFDNDYAQEDFIDYLTEIKHQVSRKRNEKGFAGYLPCEVDGFIFWEESNLNW